MKRSLRAQISVLAGVFGFFIGGLVNAGREILDVMMGAAIGWATAFFMAFFLLKNVYRDSEEEKEEIDSGRQEIRPAKNQKKGTKIDITVKDGASFDNLYNLKK
jgi:hypothetical protein